MFAKIKWGITENAESAAAAGPVCIGGDRCPNITWAIQLFKNMALAAAFGDPRLVGYLNKQIYAEGIDISHDQFSTMTKLKTALTPRSIEDSAVIHEQFKAIDLGGSAQIKVRALIQLIDNIIEAPGGLDLKKQELNHLYNQIPIQNYGLIDGHLTLPDQTMQKRGKDVYEWFTKYLDASTNFGLVLLTGGPDDPEVPVPVRSGRRFPRFRIPNRMTQGRQHNPPILDNSSGIHHRAAHEEGDGPVRSRQGTLTEFQNWKKQFDTHQPFHDLHTHPLIAAFCKIINAMKILRIKSELQLTGESGEDFAVKVMKRYPSANNCIIIPVGSTDAHFINYKRIGPVRHSVPLKKSACVISNWSHMLDGEGADERTAAHVDNVKQVIGENIYSTDVIIFGGSFEFVFPHGGKPDQGVEHELGTMGPNDLVRKLDANSNSKAKDLIRLITNLIHPAVGSRKFHIYTSERKNFN